jgi:hypothetical protein
MDTTDRRYRLIEITPGGVTGYHAPGSRTQASHRDQGELIESLEEGGIVLDSREAIEREFALVLRSPYAEPYLDPGVVTNAHGLTRQGLEGVARAVWGSASLVMLDSTESFPFTGFDTVALDLYVAFWRSHGARVGRRVEGVLVWEEPVAVS